MKDSSFFTLFKNSLAFKMKKGFKNLCIGDTATESFNFAHTNHQPTLEEMIMELDLEDKMASRTSLDHLHHRMSCVNSSDILRSARHALNQYPRFSLDGKDAMYRSSFRNFDLVNTNISKRLTSFDHGRRLCLPAKVSGERVMWCKPGVVGKLMGLEAMPIPVTLNHRMNLCLNRKQNLMKRQETERRKVDSGVSGSCSRATAGYCLMKPVAVKIH